MTRDGGATWTNVTPPSIKPWTRIFNIEAGHFDPLVAYAAANTLRLDEIAPHFYRTHDGGKTWTEINTGIAGDAVANTIREDPRQPGLLYAGTDTQVWVSFDDGDHWQSLRHNMPAISVRDLQIKDDAKCHCADLIAGTHGRGFWILDDVTPLRQAAAAKAALAKNEPYLFKPGPAVRVRFGVNEPTPWPPELPAGESAPPGALIDYYLPKDASGEVKLEILDAGGKVVRTLFEHRAGLRSGSGQGHGGLRRGLQEDADRRVLRPSALLARAAVHRLAEGGDASLQLGSQVRSGLARRSDSRRRRRGDGRGARAHVSELQRAVGAAGQLHGAAHGRRRDEDAADRGQPRSARADRAGGADASSTRSAPGCTGKPSPRTSAFNDAQALADDARRAIRRRGGCDQGRAGSARADGTAAQRAPASPARRRRRRRRRSKR